MESKLSYDVKIPSEPAKYRDAPATSSEAKPWFGILLLMFVCAVSFTMKLIARWGLTPNELADPARLTLQIEWALVLIVVAPVITLYVDRLPLSSVGIRRLGGWNVILAVLFFVAGNAAELLLDPVVTFSGLRVIPIRTWELRPIVDWSSIVAAALAEELVFRGYLIERLEALSGSTMLAITCSCLLFAVWHLPIWGAGEMLYAGAWGILFAILYAWRRNLPACVLAHLLADAVAAGDMGFRVVSPRPGVWMFSIFLRAAKG